LKVWPCLTTGGCIGCAVEDANPGVGEVAGQLQTSMPPTPPPTSMKARAARRQVRRDGVEQQLQLAS
jgi:hypothetical protein